MKTLEVVKLISDIPEKKLSRGQIGTIVEILAGGVVEVEFAERDGNPSIMHAENSLLSVYY